MDNSFKRGLGRMVFTSATAIILAAGIPGISQAEEGPRLDRFPAPHPSCYYTQEFNNPPEVALRCAGGGPDKWVKAYLKCYDQIGFVHTYTGNTIYLGTGGVSNVKCSVGDQGPYEGDAPFVLPNDPQR